MGAVNWFASSLVTRPCLALFLSLLIGSTAASAPSPTTTPAVQVFNAKLEPHWLDATHLWYRSSQPDGTTEYVLVDARAAMRGPAFDHARLATLLSEQTRQSIDASHLELRIQSLHDHRLTLSSAGKTWELDLNSYQLRDPGGSCGTGALHPARVTAPTAHDGTTPSSDPWTSPDRQQTSFIRDGNVWLRSTAGGERQLSRDGTADFPYDRVFWSPDSSDLVAYRLQRGDHLPVYRVESSPRGANDVGKGPVHRAVLHQSEYTLPGDKLDSFELNLFDVASGTQIKPKVDRLDCNEWSSHPEPSIRWRPDGRHFTYEKHDRGHQRLRIIEVDSKTGDTRNLLDEQSSTFIWTAHTENLRLQLINYLANEREILYVSERSGWRQLYLIDIESAALKPITTGTWVVRGINRIDEEKRQVWFSASGVYPDQDPYLVHYGRVNFDGTGLTWLTQSNGNHTIDFKPESDAFSPGGEFVVTNYSRVDCPPVTELHRTSDGTLVKTLETAKVVGDWRAPEVFHAKGRDGTTDIWGIICRPRDLDPAKMYPIVEDIYAGPQDAYVPKSFSPNERYASLTKLGFVVVKMDGMGTAMRSKAFHDVCWKNLADAGFPDRIQWIKAAAEKYPYMDTSRVGIYGTSAGGQNAAGR
ncbi:MAG: DPP IV N-terminal domain-containing protein [Tepidisphaeraceae bacterium]